MNYKSEVWLSVYTVPVFERNAYTDFQFNFIYQASNHNSFLNGVRNEKQIQRKPKLSDNNL